MIIKGNTRTDGGELADYLLSEGQYEKNREKNERIEVWEALGIDQGDKLQDILADFQHSAAGTQCEKPLFHVQFRTADGERLTREQWLESVNRLEERLELTGHERVIVAHTLDGQDHVHVAWNRIDLDQQKAAELHYYKHKCTDVARELEREFGLRELSDDRKRGKLSRDEEQQAQRHGKDPQAIKTAIRECWQQSDNGQALTAALDERGYMLARGDRRDFVILDTEGEVYSVARVTGSKAAEVRAKLDDLDREQLPTVAEAKEMQHDRAHGVKTAPELEAWDDALAKAAIEKAEREESEQKQQQAKELETQRALEEEQRAAHLGATLYDRADMVNMQHDAMRHLKDVHRQHERNGSEPHPMHPDEHKRQQDAAQAQQQEAAPAAEQEQDIDDMRRDFYQSLREMRRDLGAEAREDKKDRTEQTEYQQRKAERDAMREQFDGLQRQSPASSNEQEGRERERELD